MNTSLKTRGIKFSNRHLEELRAVTIWMSTFYIFELNTVTSRGSVMASMYRCRLGGHRFMSQRGGAGCRSSMEWNNKLPSPGPPLSAPYTVAQHHSTRYINSCVFGASCANYRTLVIPFSHFPVDGISPWVVDAPYVNARKSTRQKIVR